MNSVNMSEMLVKALFMLVLVSIGQGDGPLKVSMLVLYESKCPDSRDFVLNQLQPAMQLLHDQIYLKFVPFGKARSINGGSGGFQCQHGPTECRGNIVQECTLNLMADRTDLEKTEYVVCEMSSYAGAKGSLECALQANVSAEAVNQCISSGQGTALQLMSERITNKFRPKFVPTVVINGVFNQQVQDASQEDLIGTLCSLLKGTGACAQYYNNAMGYTYV